MMMIMMMASGFVTRLKSCSPCICIHHHHHHHQWRYSPINEPWPLLESFSLEDSQQIYFYRVRLSASRPTPNLEDQVSVFIPLQAGLPSYASGQWVARVPWDRHFPYPPTWAPEELYLYYSPQLFLFNLQRRTVWSMQTEYLYIYIYIYIYCTECCHKPSVQKINMFSDRYNISASIRLHPTVVIATARPNERKSSRRQSIPIE
jgi:hypothetical protein